MNRYVELVIQGHPGWGRGFVDGYFCARGEVGRIFDAEAEGFQIAPLRERILDALDPSHGTLHLLVPENLTGLAREALESARRCAYEVEIVDQQDAWGATYDFEVDIYSREHAQRIRSLFEELPEGVELSADSRFKETVDPDAKGPESYAPVHDYELHGRGTVTGPVDGVVALYRRCRAEALIKQTKARLIHDAPPERTDEA